MTLLTPTYLWGLLGLIVPIAIHLWSRKKMRVIKVGSTKFLTETKSRRSNSIQLNEWWLLILRCLVIALLVITMAQPQLSKAKTSEQIAYLFEPSLIASDQGLKRFEAIPQESRRLLKPDFPKWEDNLQVSNQDEVPNYWQLAREINQIQADSIVVFTNAFAKALKGKRPTLVKHIKWITVDTSPTERPVAALLINDSIDVVTVESNSKNLEFKSTRISNTAQGSNASNDSLVFDTGTKRFKIPKIEVELITVKVITDQSTEQQWTYLQAAFEAIEQYTERKIFITPLAELDEAEVSKSDYLIILTKYKTTTKAFRTLYQNPNDLSENIIEKSSNPNEYILTKKLSPKVVQESNLVKNLLEWLSLGDQFEELIYSYDLRTVAAEQLETNVNSDLRSEGKQITADLSMPFWIVIVLLIIAERLLAKTRKQ